MSAGRCGDTSGSDHFFRGATYNGFNVPIVRFITKENVRLCILVSCPRRAVLLSQVIVRSLRDDERVEQKILVLGFFAGVSNLRLKLLVQIDFRVLVGMIFVEHPMRLNEDESL